MCVVYSGVQSNPNIHVIFICVINVYEGLIYGKL